MINHDNKEKIWKSDTKFSCIVCKEKHYLDYYCLGCDKCCAEMARSFIDFIKGNNGKTQRNNL